MVFVKVPALADTESQMRSPGKVVDMGEQFPWQNHTVIIFS